MFFNVTHMSGENVGGSRYCQTVQKGSSGFKVAVLSGKQQQLYGVWLKEIGKVELSLKSWGLKSIWV